MENPASYDPGLYFPRPVVESRLARRLKQRSKLFVVLGPELTGKRWIMRRVLSGEASLRAIWIDVRGVNEPSDVARQIATGTQLALPYRVTSAHDLSLAVEGILDRPTMILWRHGELFYESQRHGRIQVRHLTREWATAAAYHDEFSRLRQVILTSRLWDPNYWIGVSDETVELPDLDARETSELAACLGMRVSLELAERLNRVVGGHIYFLRLALQDCAKGLSIDELCKAPLHPRGPFLRLYKQFATMLNNATPEERADARRLLMSGDSPRGMLADELTQRGVIASGRSGIRYGIFEVFLKEYFSR